MRILLIYRNQHVAWFTEKKGKLARPAGFEPATSRLGTVRSIQLSYGRFLVAILAKCWPSSHN